MKICVLSSGSKGNCTLILSGSTAIAVDFGITLSYFKEQLICLGITPEDVSAILVTHSHQDHFSGLEVLSNHYNIPVFATEETASSIDYDFLKKKTKHSILIDWSYITPGSSFEIGNLSITPFEVPHDANGAVAFTISDGKVKLGLATDLGTITNSVAYHLSDCDAMILEMNHDLDMLRESNRSEYLKSRISNKLGHLSNTQAAEFLDSCDANKLKYFFPAHISADCNDRSIIESVLFGIAKDKGFTVIETYQNAPSKVIDL